MTEEAGRQSTIIGGIAHVARPRRFWTAGKVFMLLIFLSLLGVGGYYAYNMWKGEQTAKVEVPTFEVRKDKLEISVTEEGSLQSMKSQEIRPEFRAQAKLEWIIPEESVVKLGDEVLRFDSQELTKQIDEYEVRLQEATASLVRANEDDVIAKREDSATMLSSQKAIEDAESDLDKFLNSDVPRKRADFRMRIRQARQQLREIEAEVTDLPYLIERQLKTMNDLEKAKITLEQRKSSLQNAEEDYRIYLEYELPKLLATKREAVEEAVRRFERTKNNIDSKTAQRASSIRQSERNVESITKNLEEAKDRLTKMVLKAPVAGVVFYGSGVEDEWGENIKESLKPGTAIWSGQTLLNIPDTTQMKVAVQVLEADISKIQLGLPSIITVPSLDNATYTGRVSFKARAARNIRRWDPTSTKVVPCEILIDGYDERLTPGSTVKVKIIVKIIESALIVPLENVFEKDGHPIVYLKTGPNEQCEARRIKLGDHNNTYVVVEEGLKEGDKIFQYAPATAENAPITGSVYTQSPPPTPSFVPTPSPTPNGAQVQPSGVPSIRPMPERQPGQNRPPRGDNPRPRNN